MQRFRNVLLCVALATPASAHSLASDLRTLAVAQSRPLLEYACSQVAFSLSGPGGRTAARDASALALRRFVFSKRSVNVRAWCLRNATDIAQWTRSSAYLGDLRALEDAALTSANVDDELVGARAAWGDLGPQTGLLLTQLAQPGRARSVRIAALRNLYSPSTVRGRSAAPAAAYDRAIEGALRDRDAGIVVAGLVACVMYEQWSSDDTLLAFASNRDPVVRAGVFEALGMRDVADYTNSELFASGLRDSDIRVRAAALVALRVPTRADLRLLAAFARNAPTAQDRRNAREQLTAFRNFRPFV